MRSYPPPLPEVRRALSFSLPEHGTKPDQLCFWRGRLAELSEGAPWGALTLLAGLILQTQQSGEQTAWIAAGDSVFYPPDLVWRGVDLAAVTVVWAPAPGTALQAADWLLRSGAFGLVVIDGLAERAADAELARLGRLAEDADTAAVFLTSRRDSEPALGTQVPLRVAVRPSAGGAEAAVLKDKRGATGRSVWRRHGPMGLY